MQADDWHYPRREFTHSVYVTLTRGPVPALSLFGPRRTGKTQFLQRDLGRHAAENYDHRVIYASFWQSAAAPLSVLLYACEEALRPRGYAERIAAWGAQLPVRARLSALDDAAALEIDLGRPPDMPGADALHLLDRYLERLAKKKRPAILMLDEVQELAAHPEGRELMAALRTALDRRKEGLKTVFTGSSHVGLDKVFSAREAPFYRFAAPLTLPPLDDRFVLHQLGVFRAIYRRTLKKKVALAYFERLGRNPMFFQHWLITLGLNPSMDEDTAMRHAEAGLAAALDFDGTWLDLGPLHRAMAVLVAERCPELFGRRGAERLAEITGEDAPSPQVRQSALRLLERRQIVDTFEKERRIADPLFERWILDRQVAPA